MRIKRRDTPEADYRKRVFIQSLYPWQNVAVPPFECGWYTIAPGQSSASHNHYEPETFIIVDGAGQVCTNGDASPVCAGDTIFLPAFSEHRLVNSSATDPLRYLAIWWEQAATSPAQREKEKQTDGVAAELVITVSRPTPNSDLHLGHLAGPYVAADVLARATRMRGHTTRLVCGTDDHQTYVALRAARAGTSAAAVVAENSARIMRAFELANIRFDRFVRSSQAPQHKALAQKLLCDLHATGSLVERDVPTLYCGHCATFAVEGLGKGTCRHCGSTTYADGCEACGLPNFGVDLQAACCSLCDGPVELRSVRRLVFPLERFRPAVEAFLGKALVGHHLRAFVGTVLLSPLPEIPVTVPASWGIDVPVAGFGDQRISAWFEVAVALLATCEGSDEGTVQNRRIVQLFGIDNGFFYAIYYPALLSASGRRPPQPDALIMNHFYQINGAKFSSGRTNALWANDVLGDMPVDLVRFYLSLTRPEDSETAFSEEEFREIVGREVRGAWGGWLSALERRVDDRCGGLAPFPAGWTTTQRLFFTQLADWIALIDADLSWRRFSPRRAASAICELVHGAVRFAALMEAEHGADASLMTTAIAIELAAAKALAGTVYPIMPEFGVRLWTALGLAGEPTWRELGTLLPGGQRIRGLGQALERPS